MLIFEIVDTIAEIVTELVSSEAIMIYRNSDIITDNPIKITETKTNFPSISKDDSITSIIVITTMVEQIIPKSEIKIAELMMERVSSIFLFSMLLAKNLWIPLVTPIDAIAVIKAERETMVEEVPITAGDVILDKINQ